MHKHHKKMLERLVEGPQIVDDQTVQPLVEWGYVELDPQGADDEGLVQARIAPSVLEEVQQLVKEKTVSDFEIVDGLIPNDSVRGGRGTRPETYPFSKLEVGQSFPIPATDKMPNPVKDFASTVSGANRRYSEETEETFTNRRGNVVPRRVQLRKFEIRAVKVGQTYEGSDYVEKVDGARIFRVQ